MRPLRKHSAIIEIVGRFREVELTAYVRFRIREWEKSDRPLTEIEALGKPYISAGYTTRVREGQSGVSGHSAKGFAKAFGFANEIELRKAAYDWYEKHGQEIETKAAAPEDPELAAALASVRVLYSDDPKEIEQSIHEMLEESRDIPAQDRDEWIRRLQIVHRRRVGRRGQQFGMREREGEARRKRRRLQGEMQENPPSVEQDEKPASAKPGSRRKTQHR